MMRYIITAIALFAASALQSAEYAGLIRGKIIDKNTLEPLSGVYIIYGKHLGTTSDKNGLYLITTNSRQLTTLLFNLLVTNP